MTRYFLDRDGVSTTRIGNAPGKSHLDIATNVLLAIQAITPKTDLYDAMFRRGYARVRETETGVLVETPAIKDSVTGQYRTEQRRRLTPKQDAYLQARAAELKVPLEINTPEIIDSKETVL